MGALGQLQEMVTPPKMRLCPELGSPGKLGASGVGVKTHWSFFTQVPSGS